MLEHEPLAPRTTLEVGGAARYFAPCPDVPALRAALAWAGERQLPVFVLGGGSNLLVADEGFPGLVVALGDRSLRFAESGADGWIEAGAGVVWDEVVAAAVERGWAGLECLSGIPGSAGAAPMQNIGAYGQELSETLASVTALDRSSGELATLAASELELGYRTSLLKTRWRDRFVVTGLRLRLGRGQPQAPTYRELVERLAGQPTPTVAAVREAVLAIRREKAMVIDAADPDTRSAGSFFVNPVVGEAAAQEVRERVAQLRGKAAAEAMPCFPAGPGTAKLSAAWLIEAAGFHRGYCLGAAGLSTRHVLALVSREHATAADILALAKRVRDRVHDAFGLVLVPEPVLLGCQLDR